MFSQPHSKSQLLASERLCWTRIFLRFRADFGHDIGVENLTFIAASPWQYTPQGDARWAGLMLKKMDADADSKAYQRQGVFLGLSVQEQLHGWERKTVTLI